jgi:hypothetical protein
MFWDELTGDFGKPSSTASVLSPIERSADLSDSLVVIFFFSGAGSFIDGRVWGLIWPLPGRFNGRRMTKTESLFRSQSRAPRWQGSCEALRTHARPRLTCAKAEHLEYAK